MVGLGGRVGQVEARLNALQAVLMAVEELR